jgi:PleD family two-component response regulator
VRIVPGIAVDMIGQRKRVAHMPTATTTKEKQQFENGPKSPTRLHEEAFLIRAAVMPEANSTILVIDDDPDVRAPVGRLLQSLGMNVQLFASISDFLKSDPPNGPTCLVLDVRLRQDGLRPPLTFSNPCQPGSPQSISEPL